MLGTTFPPGAQESLEQIGLRTWTRAPKGFSGCNRERCRRGAACPAGEVHLLHATWFWLTRWGYRLERRLLSWRCEGCWGRSKRGGALAQRNAGRARRDMTRRPWSTRHRGAPRRGTGKSTSRVCNERHMVKLGLAKGIDIHTVTLELGHGLLSQTCSPSLFSMCGTKCRAASRGSSDFQVAVRDTDQTESVAPRRSDPF